MIKLFIVTFTVISITLVLTNQVVEATKCYPTNSCDNSNAHYKKMSVYYSKADVINYEKKR